jgi:hypothetical protein
MPQRRTSSHDDSDNSISFCRNPDSSIAQVLAFVME